MCEKFSEVGFWTQPPTSLDSTLSLGPHIRLLGVYKWRKDEAKAAVAVFLLKILRGMEWPTSYWSSAVGCFGKGRTYSATLGWIAICLSAHVAVDVGSGGMLWWVGRVYLTRWHSMAVGIKFEIHSNCVPHSNRMTMASVGTYHRRTLDW